MRGLSLTQPWATLVACGAKRIETRSWSTDYRGWLAIHAAKGLSSVDGVAGLKELCRTEPFLRALTAGQPKGITFAERLPLGAIVAVGNLHHVGQIYHLREEVRLRHKEWTVQGDELAFGDYTPGRYGWVFTNVHPLAEPISCRGALSLWELPPDVFEAVRRQLPYLNLED